MLDPERSETLLRELVEQDKNLFAMYPLAEFEARLDATPRYEKYNFKTEQVQAWWSEIDRLGGSAAIALYNRALLLYLLSRFKERAVKKTYTDSILALYKIELDRIVNRVQEDTEGRFAIENDLFLKDLGICRQMVFPVGYELEGEGGLPRNILLKGGVIQFFRYAWFLLIAGRGRMPWYEGHLHLDGVDFSFTREARETGLLRQADMLVANPHVKGKVGYSWFHDPVLEDISPEVGSNRRLISANGGWLFRVGRDSSNSAFARSETRRRLHREGKYNPTVYMIAWPRRHMIGWAEEVRKSRGKKAKKVI